MSDQLSWNALHGLSRTLRYLSSGDLQLEYKRKVPFVHVPNELLAQLDQVALLTREQSWFKRWFSDVELRSLAALTSRAQQLGEPDDVPDALDDKNWRALMKDASDCLSVLGGPNFPERCYSDAKEAASFLVRWRPELLTGLESQVERAAFFTAKAQASSSDKHRARLLEKANLTPEVVSELKQGHDAFRVRVAERLKNAGVEPTRCPSCERVVASREATQCLWCGSSWKPEEAKE